MAENLNKDVTVTNEESLKESISDESPKTEELSHEEKVEKFLEQLVAENKRKNKFLKYLLGMAFIVFVIVIYFFIYWLSIVGRIFI